MRKITTLLVALTALFAFNLNGQNAWFNEIHYDNIGTDANEMIEIIVEDPGSYTLSLFQIDFYNGSNGTIYNTNTLDEFTVGTTVGNFTFYYYMYPTNGIQNGNPDGMALSYNGTLISGQFLSYEGTFDAAEGIANGLTSVDIGVSESNSSTLDTESLQLTGSGTQYSSFTWTGPVTSNAGSLNTGQSLTGGPLPEPTNYPTNFAATASGNMIETTWTDATGAQLPSAYVVFISEADDIVAPVDGIPVPDDLDLSDGSGAKNVNYGSEAYTFEDLETSTLYYFAIYPYTNGGATIDYKTDGTAPEATATTTSVVLFEDFDWSWMAWERVSVIGAQEWDRDNSFGIGGSNCALMSGFDGGAQDNEDWLISPRFDLSAVTAPVLTFFNACNYSGPDIEIKYSTNYDGGGDPSTATWTDLSATLSGGGWSWVSSGNIDLSGISGNVHLAFVYYSNPSDGSKTWEIDNVMVTGDAPDPAGVVINEIMYNSPGADEEWIELYNNTAGNIDVSGWFIQDNTSSNTPVAIPDGTVLAPDQYYTISIATDGAFPFVPDLDGTTQSGFALNNSGDDVNLFNLGRLRADHVPYDDGAPWPTEPDGNGPSLSLLDPDLDNTLGENWAASLQPDLGSPGAENFPPVPTILVTSPIGGEMWEIGSTHDITWDTIVYTGQIKIELVDTNTMLPQLLVSNISSTLMSWTWEIFSGLSLGDDYIIRISDLAGGPVGESPNTFSIVEPYVQPEIVITEIMYNPPESGNDSLEFIELYNNGADPVDLTGFYFSDGVDYTFPAITLNPAEYMLVSIDSVAMMNTFGTMAYQWTSGALSNSGELIQLLNDAGMFVDSVRYDDAAPWDPIADGNGPSLTFCNPELDNGLAENWSASTEFAAVNANLDSIYATPLAGCSVVPVTADFMAADTTVAVGDSTDFTDMSSGGTIIAWNWTFEGGMPATSVEQNPGGIVYDTQGTYDVELIVENDFGDIDTLAKTDYISVDLPPVADFEADATNPAVGQGVNFTDLSTGTINSWLWVFEGGSPDTSLLEIPVPIVYNMEGTYDVSLTVANDYGEDTMLKEDYIDVQPIGIPELDGGQISIYPNPSNGTLNIENAGGSEVMLSIYSITGQQLVESRIPQGKKVIDLSELEAGIYFVRYLSEDRLVKTGKLIVN